MGGRSGRNRAAQADPFYSAIPPSAYEPTGGLGGYGPYSQGYTSQHEPAVTMGGLYGRPPQIGPNNLGGRYAQGNFHC
jgi:hypothetical protein